MSAGAGRRSSRGRPIHWLASALVMGMLAQTTSYLVWKDLAGSQLVLRQVRVVDATGPRTTAAPHTRTASAAQVRRAPHAPAQPRRVGPRVVPATVADGTTVALGVTLLLHGAAFLAMGQVVRRRRTRARSCAPRTAETAPGPEPEPEPDPEAGPPPVTAALGGAAGPPARAEREVEAPVPPAEPPPRTWRESVVLFDAGEATRVAHTSLVRLEWDGQDLVTRTSHISVRDISCLFPAGRETLLPPATTVVRVTLQLDGSWVTLPTRLSRHRTSADGRVLDLALVEPAANSAALLRMCRAAPGRG